MRDVAGTAYWIAAARARESLRPDRLFDDPFAARLAGERGTRMLALSESGTENPFLPVRTRFFDDVLHGWAAAGRQVVLLGAGLDTRAYRMSLPVTMFEVDDAELLAEKAQALTGCTPRCDRRTVAADLRGPWTDALRATGFDPAAPTCWLGEGLLFYLSTDEVHTLLRTTAELSAPESVLVADTFGTGLLRLPAIQRREPQPFCTDDPAALCASTGWPSPVVTCAGAPEANYGRLHRSSGTPDPTSRSYLVVARQPAMVASVKPSASEPDTHTT